MLPDVDEKSAPEPTASEPAMAAVARGMRTFLLVRTLMVVLLVSGPGAARRFWGDRVDPVDQKPTEAHATRSPREGHTLSTVGHGSRAVSNRRPDPAQGAQSLSPGRTRRSRTPTGRDRHLE
ncbi:hypothetical protein GCM10009721_09540 [Terrabacter tumescens]|uniref:Uncharacterized protein n=1 Tax=Terrabacter tumescens TaxID=60443 RepID=A0ABQ2HQU4_9MICO|nr:hypothetical protein GCM10009721_09540 [Terrabacter tumescens]